MINLSRLDETELVDGVVVLVVVVVVVVVVSD